MKTDKELIDAIALKDEYSFLLLYRKYWKLFYSWCLKKINELGDVQDLLQNFWVWIWEHADKIKCDDNAMCKNYLLHLLSYRITDYYRNLRKTDRPEGDHIFDLLAYEVIKNDVINDLKFNELQNFIVDCIGRLNPNLQRVYQCRYQEELSVKETAKVLSVSEGTIRNQSSNILIFLRRELLNSEWKCFMNYLILIDSVYLFNLYFTIF